RHALLQRDRVLAFLDALPAIAVSQAVQQRANAALALVRDGLKRVLVEGELLVLGADAPGRTIRLRTLLEMRDQIAEARQRRGLFFGVGQALPPAGSVAGMWRLCGRS